MSAVALQDPIPILKYLKKKHLSDQNSFLDIGQITASGQAPSRLAQVFKAKTNPQDKGLPIRRSSTARIEASGKIE